MHRGGHTTSICNAIERHDTWVELSNSEYGQTSTLLNGGVLQGWSPSDPVLWPCRWLPCQLQYGKCKLAIIPFQDGYTVSTTDVVRDLRSIAFVVHKK